jgi:hypothetical protein
MLSVVDLVERETLSLEQASWLLRRILEGSSFLVGATPGGAGKTAVMGALLAMLPPQTQVYLTSGERWKKAPPGSCLVAYELNDAFYEAYIWGRELQEYARLGREGRRLVSNLHADTVEEAREQIVVQCGVGEEEFRGFSIFIPITVGGGFSGRSRVVERIFQADHQGWLEAEPAADRAIASFLTGLLEGGVREIEAVREGWVGALRRGDL